MSDPAVSVVGVKQKNELTSEKAGESQKLDALQLAVDEAEVKVMQELDAFRLTLGKAEAKVVQDVKVEDDKLAMARVTALEKECATLKRQLEHQAVNLTKALEEIFTLKQNQLIFMTEIQKLHKTGAEQTRLILGLTEFMALMSKK